MPPVPQTIPPVQEPAIASFDSEDLATGANIKNFNLIIGETSTGKIYKLITNEVNSVVIDDVGPQDLIFDSLPFNLPRRIKGNGFFSAQIRSRGSGSVVSCTVKVQIWDGASATDISSEIISQTIPNSIVEDVFIPISFTETQVKRGESIRLLLNLSVSNTEMGFSPTNQTGTAGLKNTKSFLGIPFRVGL